MQSNSVATDVLNFSMNSSRSSGLRVRSRGLLASSGRVNSVSISSIATQQLFDLLSEPTIYVGIYEGVDGWIACDQNDGNYVSCIAEIVLGIEMDHCIDDEVWGPAQAVDDADRYNHFGDALAHAYDTLNSKWRSFNFTSGRNFKREEFKSMLESEANPRLITNNSVGYTHK